MYKLNKKIPCVYMRGGTSKGCFFHDKDLPPDESHRDKVILSAFGSPDLRQIDGMGGANTSTSKVVIIKKSDREDADIDFTFGQVSIDQPFIGKTQNCANLSTAVGPFAIDEGLIEAVEPITTVRILNTNTNKLIVARVPVKDGRAMTEGDFEIDGVPGTGAKIQIEFLDPEGAISGNVLPSGNAKDQIEIDGKVYEYSFLDSVNPGIFARAEQFGLTGLETPWEFEALPNCDELRRIFEIIRGTCAVMLGLATDLEDARVNSPSIPRMTICTGPKDYTAPNGKVIRASDIDLTGRSFSVGMKMIQAYMGAGSIGTLSAANISGTVVSELLCDNRPDSKVTTLRIGHPFGIMVVDGELEDMSDGAHRVKCGLIGRTARRIMEGYVYVRD